ncbi:MAG: sulfite exporter TauE/SafE family protein [Candidatus Altiarchaeota archaeon]
MIFELALWIGLGIVATAFVCEYLDSTLGMGYGTILTPVLLILGFQPMQIVPSVLLSELFTGILAGFTHHELGNVELFPRKKKVKDILRRLHEIGYVNGFREEAPKALKITMLIASCSIIGTVVAVLIAVSIPKFYLKLYIAVLITLIGAVILASRNMMFAFSWRKITALSILASFNKGLSGGGYGPVVTGGQILSGVDEKNAIGITSLAEGLTCVVGVFMYFVTGVQIDWVLAPYLLVGAILSVPISAYTVKIIKTDKLRLMIGVVTLILGAYAIYSLIG